MSNPSDRGPEWERGRDDAMAVVGAQRDRLRALLRRCLEHLADDPAHADEDEDAKLGMDIRAELGEDDAEA